MNQQYFQSAGQFAPKTFAQSASLWVLRNYSTDQAERDKYGLGAPRPYYRLNLLEILVLALVVVFVVYSFAHASFAAIDPLTLNTLPGALSTVISNAKQFLLLGTAAAMGLVLVRAGMFFIAGLARSIMAAAG